MQAGSWWDQDGAADVTARSTGAFVRSLVRMYPGPDVCPGQYPYLEEGRGGVSFCGAYFVLYWVCEPVDLWTCGPVGNVEQNSFPRGSPCCPHHQTFSSKPTPTPNNCRHLTMPPSRSAPISGCIVLAVNEDECNLLSCLLGQG